MNRRKCFEDGWRPAALLGEAFKNAFASRSRLFGVLVVAVIMGLALTGFRYFEVHLFEQQLNSLRESGRNVLLVQGISAVAPPRIDRTSCENLSRQKGVVASGALIEQSRVSFPQLGNSVPVFMGSTTLFPELQRFDAVIGSQIIGAPSGSKMFIAAIGKSLEAIIGEKRPLGISVNNALTLGIDPLVTMVDHCIVILDQEQRPSDEIPALLAQLIVEDNPVVAAPLISNILDPYDQFESRPSRTAPVALGVAFATFLALLMQLRSSELAAYRLSGTGRLSLLNILVFEAIVVAGLYWASGAISSLLLLGQDVFHVLGLLADHLFVASTVVVASLPMLALVTQRSPMDLAKER